MNDTPGRRNAFENCTQAILCRSSDGDEIAKALWPANDLAIGGGVGQGANSSSTIFSPAVSAAAAFVRIARPSDPGRSFRISSACRDSASTKPPMMLQ